jgi:hypothetical protein
MDRWAEHTVQALTKDGFMTHVRPSSVLAWKATRRRGSLEFTDGVEVRRIWIAPRRAAVCGLAKRIYFQAGKPDLRPEFAIVGGNRPASVAVGEILTLITRALHLIRTESTPHGNFVALESIAMDRESAREVQIGGHACLPDRAGLNGAYRAQGFDGVPAGFSITVIPTDGVNAEFASDTCTRLERAAFQRHAALVTRVTTCTTAMARAAHITTTGTQGRPGTCALLLLKTKTAQPHPDALQLMRCLDAAAIPYRRAYADDPVDFSVPDQLPSLLLACGGRPHRVNLQHQGSPVWMLGLDLGHPTEDDRSTLVATLIAPNGALFATGIAMQRRDETMCANALAKVVSDCLKTLPDGEFLHTSLVVLRDGRMFERDSIAVLRSACSCPMTLLEVRKGHNPLAVQSDDTSVGNLVPGPFACRVPGERTLFLNTCIPKSSAMLPAMLKVTWSEQANDLDFDATSIARLLTASSAAPSLGLHPHHLPAALYWADGIAGRSESDLRFWGVRGVGQR